MAKNSSFIIIVFVYIQRIITNDFLFIKKNNKYQENTLILIYNDFRIIF